VKKKTNFFQQGLTAIELLVVLVIIGILVVIFAQWVNPRIQIGRAKKAREQAMMLEFLRATLRYYQAHGDFPGITVEQYEWAIGDGSFCRALFVGETQMVEMLIEEGELKSSFANEDLFNDEGNEQIAILLDPSKCDCDPSESIYCDQMAQAEGPWACVVPFTEEDQQAAESQGGNDLVYIKTTGEHDDPEHRNSLCTIYDPSGDSGCHVMNPWNWDAPWYSQPCWRCYTP